MNRNAIPCTVQLLTRNSAGHLEACLDSLKDFEEIVLQDGGSTDATLEIARRYPNVRFVPQEKRYLDADGRITDFAAVRNAGINAASHQWIFMTDSDEIVPKKTVVQINNIVHGNDLGVYQVFRRFVVGGVPVQLASVYPVYQMRLYHKSLVEGYVKPIHERLNLHPGVTVQTLSEEILVPLPAPAQLRPKYDRYLAMEAKRAGVMTWPGWVKWVLFRNIRTAVGIMLGALLLRVSGKKGFKLPWVYEWQFIDYALRTILVTFPRHAKRANH